MPFEIDSIDTKVYNQLTNGATFTLNQNSFDKTFTANPEKVRIVSTYEYTWFASSDLGAWNVQSGVIQSLSIDFRAEGFEVGQVFEFYNDWSDRIASTAEFTARITSFENNGTGINFTVVSGAQFTINAAAQNVGIWCDPLNENNLMGALFVRFGLPLNSESDTFLSKIDNSLQKYYIEDLPVNGGSYPLQIGTPTSGQYTGEMRAVVIPPTQAGYVPGFSASSNIVGVSNSDNYPGGAGSLHPGLNYSHPPGSTYNNIEVSASVTFSAFNLTVNPPTSPAPSFLSVRLAISKFPRGQNSRRYKIWEKTISSVQTDFGDPIDTDTSLTGQTITIPPTYAGLLFQSDNYQLEIYIDDGVTGDATGSFSYTISTATITVSEAAPANVNKNRARLEITHDLLLNPIWLETDTPDVLINPPGGDVKNILSVDNERFAGAECLRYIQEIEVRNGFTNAQGRKATVRLDGNSGWYQDNFNSGSKNFEFHEGSLIINSGANTRFQFGQENTFQFDLKASDGSDIPSNSPFGVYFQVLPDETRYQNKTTLYKDNFVYDGAVSYADGNISVGENNLLTEVKGVITTVSGQDMIRVTGRISDLSGTQAQYNDIYNLWAGCETPNESFSDVACNAAAQSGGDGVTELTITLNPAGGVITFDLDALGVVDKFEILHNGVKVATSSMISVNNGGVYDPATDNSNSPDTQWYIGTQNGTIPDFVTNWEAATGFSGIPLTSGYQQRLWWIYTAGDYTTAASCILRATGSSGTQWKVFRICA